MSRRNKLQKFSDLHVYPNVYENLDATNPKLTGQGGVTVDMKGKWCEGHFKNNRPLTLELACGKGDYTIGLAQLYPERNFIGVDIKGARIWRGASTALENGVQNAAFLRTRIEQIELFFEKKEVSEIWITFPDPFLRGSKVNRRLTSPMFLDRYQNILQKGGIIHLKTDEIQLYDFTLETLSNQQDYQLLYHDSDIYAKPLPLPELEIKTFYERQHLANGKTIKYVQFRFEG